MEEMAIHEGDEFMALLLSNGRLSRFVITISFSLALALGTNFTIVNAYASNQSSEDKASISLEQTTPSNDKVVQLQKPATVKGLKATLESISQITLKWTAVSGATSYKIYRSEKSGGTYTPIGTSTTSDYSDDGLKVNTTYYYKVSGVNAEGEGAQSSSVHMKTVAAKPKAVTGLVTRVESDDQVDLKWNEVSGAKSYKIYRSTKSTGDDYKRIGTSTTTSFSDTGLKSKATYYYEVSAVNEVSEGDRSNPVLGATKVPGKATKLSVEVISESQLDLSWKAVSGALSYKIYRSSSSSGSYTSIGTSETNSYSNKDLKANASYYYKVSAVNGVGEGTQTSAVLGETKVPGQVTSLRLKVIDDSRLELNWKEVSGAESYEIYCSTSLHGNDYTSIGTTTTTSFTDRGLKERTMYYYRVSAVNDIGEGTKSSIVSGRTK